VKDRSSSIFLPLLLVLCWAGCDQNTPGAPSGIATSVGPSVDQAVKPEQPIRITTGQLVYDLSQSQGPHIDLKGPKGLRLSSTFEGPFGPEQSCVPCEPGARITLNSIAVGSDLRGTVRLQGKTYDRIGGAGTTDPQLQIEFKGEGFLAPAFTDAATVELSGAPFTFSGTFTYHPDGSALSVTETLTGNGIATVRLTKIVVAPDDMVWRTTHAVFEFTR
jgi:hypothetical protein